MKRTLANEITILSLIGKKITKILLMSENDLQRPRKYLKLEYLIIVKNYFLKIAHILTVKRKLQHISRKNYVTDTK